MPVSQSSPESSSGIPPEDRQPFVSVVTPFYNTETYLAECIESVLRQTYRNWEYILVNNCSTDASASIAARYAQKDSRIRLIHNTEFLSQVKNYNHALRQISPQSKYCKIVQADDWIYPECLSRMVTVAESDPAIGIVSSYRLWGTQVLHCGLPYNRSKFSGAEINRKYFVDDFYVCGSPTDVLYRSDLVFRRDPFYDESVFPSEDADLCIDLLQSCDLGFVHQVLTYARVEANSIEMSLSKLGSRQLFRMQMIAKYGGRILGFSEYADCKKNIERVYYKYLGRHLLEFRDSSFWRFHREGLRLVGERIVWWRVLMFVPFALLERAAKYLGYQLVELR